MTHDELVKALMNGVDPWALQEEAGAEQVNETVEYLENWSH